MKNLLTANSEIENQVDSALAIWEWALEDKGKFLELLKQNEGQSVARNTVIEIVDHFDSTYELAKEKGFDDSYDWVFVPKMANWITLHLRNIKDLHYDHHKHIAMYCLL